MKKVITMIGTSIFENYRNDNKTDSVFSNYLETLKDKDMNNYENDPKIQYIKNKLGNWISGIDKCAELKSVSKIAKETKDKLEVYFLTSDTVLSNIVFEIIKENWEKFEELKNFSFFPNSRSEASKAIVKGLQIKNREQFVNKGMINLVNKIFEIANGYWDNIIINITTGYKAIIPYLTILAQVFKCPIYYIFEDTDTLIKIPYIPIDIKWDIFKENKEFFFKLETEKISEIPIDTKLKEEIESLVERVDNIIELNPLGTVLWEKYKNSFYLFKISDIALDYIKKKDKDNIINDSLVVLINRLKENPSDPDLNHPLTNEKLPEDFKIFKHKENNLQIRICYKSEEYTTNYQTKELKIYIGLIAMGRDVHNAGNEYVDYFNENLQKIENLESYKIYEIKKFG